MSGASKIYSFSIHYKIAYRVSVEVLAIKQRRPTKLFTLLVNKKRGLLGYWVASEFVLV